MLLALRELMSMSLWNRGQGPPGLDSQHMVAMCQRRYAQKSNSHAESHGMRVNGVESEGGVSETQGPGHPAGLGIICFSGENAH